ncbi:hypothetical protein ARMGADRAFT_1009105, partial [Armillaria gallica]
NDVLMSLLSSCFYLHGVQSNNPSFSSPISYLFSNASHLGPPKECSRRQLGLTPRSSYLGRLQAGARTYAWAVTGAKLGDEFRLLRVNGICVLADTTRNCHLRRPCPFDTRSWAHASDASNQRGVRLS